MKISKQARREAKELFRCCLSEGRLEAGRVRQAVQLVIEKKPRGYAALLTRFQRLVKLEEARRTARVEAATALSPELQGAVRGQLATLYGPVLNLTFAQNPALIGGLRIKVGSDVYDGSVQARLADLSASF